MTRRYLVCGLLLVAAAAPARAHNHILYECTDASGAKQFTNIPADPKGCKKLNVLPASGPSPSPAVNDSAPRPQTKSPPIATPSSFPRVDRALQRERDNDRRRILESELGTEEKLLQQAKKDLAEQESVRRADEKNYQRVLDRIEPFQKKVRLHENNVANIRSEISKLR